MSIKIRPYGVINLLHLFITIVLICLCVFLPLYSLFYQNYNFLYFLTALFIYPLALHFIQVYNRYILVTPEAIIFQIDYVTKSIFHLPQFYQDEFSLSDLKYYGVYSAPYIRGYQKTPREKKANLGDGSVKYDGVIVKEGKLKVPHGAIIVGNPLAFVFQKEQYIIDDYLFTSEQYANLFAVIEHNCGKAPSGAVKSGSLQQKSSGIINSLFAIFAIVIAIVLPFILRYLAATLTSWPINLQQFSYLDTALMAFVVLGNLSLSAKFILRSLKRQKPQNFQAYDVMEFVANILASLFYLLASVFFLFGYIF